MTCPAETTWLRFLGGELDEPGVHDLEHHLDGCASCRFVYADLARSGAATDPPHPIPLDLAEPAPLARGTLVGRYVILAPLGRGGMGVVYKAFDPELDRPIALKLVGLVGRDQEQARTRLLREAKTLARLSHPNVVAVHDVGTYRDDVFVAMEYIAGATLRAWLRDRPRAPREVLGVFLAAGAGLAAAHRVGIVHRDFKPENVMVGDDGRVRVLDFGLARTVMLALPMSLPSVVGPRDAHLDVTRDGVIAGTPAYMAPEQDAGRDADARSDQFSFCAALYEALFGQRAFAGEAYAELAEHRTAGDVRAPPSIAGVTGRVRRAVLRGLRAEPAERHAAMDALLVELGANRWSVRTRAAVAALAVGSLAAGGWATWVATHPPPTTAETCAIAAAGVDGVWNLGRRGDLVRAFGEAGGEAGVVIAARIAGRFEAWATDWAHRRRELCEETLHADAEQTSLTADRLQCLRRRLGHLEAIVSVCTHGTSPKVVAVADKLSEDLPSSASCDARDNTTASEAKLDRWQPLIRDIVAAQFAGAAGDIGEMERVSSAAVKRARELGERLPLGPGLVALGTAQSRRGALDEARATLREAIRVATAEREDSIAVQAWIELVAMAFRDRKLGAELDAAVFGAEIAVTRLPAEDLLHAQVAFLVGSVRVMRGELDDGERLLARARDLWTAGGAEKQRYNLAAIENSLGGVALARGAWVDANRHLYAGLAVWEAVGGPNVNTGITLGSLADVAALQGHFDEAEQLAARSIEVLEATGPSAHAELGRTLNQLAYVHVHTGHCDRARPLIARSRALLIESFGAESPMVALSLLVEAECDLASDRKRAAAALERALAMTGDRPGNIFQLPATHLALAKALDTTDRPRALELAERARAGFAKYPGFARYQHEAEAWLAARR